MSISHNSESLIYQFKFAVADSKPAIWRRVQVFGDINFEKLHYIILASTDNWTGLHHYSFYFTNKKEVSSEIENKLTKTAKSKAKELGGDLKYGSDMFYKNILRNLSIGRDSFFDLNTDTKLSDLFLHEGQRCRYDYNSTNAIILEVILEKILPAQSNVEYPICTKAVRQFPDEDLNGLWEYEEILAILEKPKSKRKIPEEYKDFVESMIGDNDEYDPEQVSIEDINLNLCDLDYYKSNTEDYYAAGKEHNTDSVDDLLLIQKLISFDKHGKPFLDYSKLDLQN